MSTDMGLAESAERFSEGLCLAASRCRELGRAQNLKTWSIIADQLDIIRKKGESVIVAKALSRKEILESLGRKVGAETVH